MRLLLLPLLAACSSKPHPDTTATTVGGDFGELTVWLDTEQGLLITRDETELAWIRPDQFQAREASASYEMRFGSFLIEETAETDWISGNRLSDLKPFSDRIQFAVRDIDENVITMGEVVSHDDGHLSIELASMTTASRSAWPAPRTTTWSGWVVRHETSITWDETSSSL